MACRCTGFTGGCTYKFCHRRVLQFKDVAARILALYDDAVKLDYDTADTKSDNNDDGDDVGLFSFEKLHKDELIYVAELPDQCAPGVGTTLSGRQCVLDDNDVGSCRKICCRGKYREKRIEVHAECRCKFVYCCRVECHTCVSYKDIHQCL